jgi:hypothetical protein
MASLSDSQEAGDYEDQMHDEHVVMRGDNVRLKEEVKELKEQNARLTEGLAQVMARLEKLEGIVGTAYSIKLGPSNS